MPEYRKVPASIQIDGANPAVRVTGQRISRLNLPEFARDKLGEEAPLGHSIGELEAVIAGASGSHVRMSPPGAQELVGFMNRENGDPFQTISELYWSVSVSSLQSVIDRVRTIHGADRATVNVTTAQASGNGSHHVKATSAPPPTRRPWWRSLVAIFVVPRVDRGRARRCRRVAGMGNRLVLGRAADLVLDLVLT